ncbi:MAG: Hsp20/alpha crystallin family protein [Candidatus Bathyarchaeota archaeon]
MSTRKKRTVFDVFEEIREEINRFFEEFMGPMLPVEAPMQNISNKELQPLTHISETEENIIITIDLPCVRKEDIKINATESMVRVEAPMRECIRIDFYGPLQRVEFEVFKKTIKLPTLVDPKRAKARFRLGVLEIILPKKVVGFRIPVE